MKVFLFDQRAVKDDTKLSFMRALSSCIETPFRSRLFEGSLIIWRLASKVVSVKKYGDGTSYETRMDSNVVEAILGAIEPTFLAGENSLDHARFVECLLRHSIDCIGIQGPGALASDLDARLRLETSYLGFMSPDLGDPLHYELLVSGLIPRTLIVDYDVFEAWPEPMILPQDYPGFVRHAISDAAFENLAGPLPRPLPPSRSGLQSLSNYREALRNSPMRVRDTLARSVLDHSNDALQIDAPAVDASVRGPVRKLNEELDLRRFRKKLAKYVLNASHAKGRHKARVFAATLGVSEQHWLSIAAQLARNVPDAELYNLRQSDYGFQFSARINVVGIDGRSAVIETGWIIRNGDIDLTTAYIAGTSKQPEKTMGRSSRVPLRNGKADFDAIFRVAHSIAMTAYSAYQPAPILLIR